MNRYPGWMHNCTRAAIWHLHDLLDRSTFYKALLAR